MSHLIHGAYHHSGGQSAGQVRGGVILGLEQVIDLIDCVKKEEGVTHTEQGRHALGCEGGNVITQNRDSVRLYPSLAWIIL